MNENEKILQNLKATMAIENCFLESSDIVLLENYLNNNILEDEAVEMIKKEFK